MYRMRMRILAIYLWMDDGNYYMLHITYIGQFINIDFKVTKCSAHRTRRTMYVHNQCRGDAVESQI